MSVLIGLIGEVTLNPEAEATWLRFQEGMKDADENHFEDFLEILDRNLTDDTPTFFDPDTKVLSFITYAKDYARNLPPFYRLLETLTDSGKDIDLIIKPGHFHDVEVCVKITEEVASFRVKRDHVTVKESSNPMEAWAEYFHYMKA